MCDDHLFRMASIPSSVGSNITDPVEARFSQLEQTLELFQENARQLGVIASDFQPRSQDPLNQKLQTLISGLEVCVL